MQQNLHYKIVKIFTGYLEDYQRKKIKIILNNLKKYSEFLHYREEYQLF